MTEATGILVDGPACPLPGDAIRPGRRGAIALGNDSVNPEVLYVLGVLALKEERHQEAIDLLERAVALDGDDADRHYCLGVAYRGRGRAQKAVACFEAALGRKPEFAEVHNDLGTLLVELGRAAEATESFRRAVRLRPGYAEAQANLGLALRKKGDLEGAANAFEAALGAGVVGGGVAKELGLVRARQGRHAEAAAAFRRSLQADPSDVDVHNELGIILARLRRFAEAEAAYREAIRRSPGFPDAHNNLGNALRNQRKPEAAVAEFREALRLRPEYPEAFNNLGIALKQLGKVAEAVACYEQALRHRSDYPEAHNNLGVALAARGKLDAAIVSYHQAIRLRPGYVEAHVGLAEAFAGAGRLAEAAAVYRQALTLRPRDAKLHKCLGNALARAEKYDEAVRCYGEALRIRPEYPDALNDLGIALSRQGKVDDSVAAYRRAIAAQPNFAEAYNNMGNVLRNSGRFEEGLAAYLKALDLKPGYADAHNNLGIAYAEVGRFDDAIASYTRCLEIRADHVDAHMNRALTWLRKGDYAQGWAEYEWRWKKRKLTNRPLIMPQWNGFPLAGRRILLITEQGLGDTLQFVRFATQLKRQGAGEVILECPERLVPLLEGTAGIDHLVPQGKPLPAYDVYCPLMNVPGLTAISVEAIPAEVPYIHARPDLAERWARELARYPGMKVGINWQGNPKYAGDKHRSIPLEFFEPLSRVPGVTLFSLQKNAGHEQIAKLAGKFPVVDLGPRLDEESGPFLDTAAVMKNLDLFISSDTSVVHLAGALGVPVWMALSTTPDWRWMTGRADNPWYPSMQVFRQVEHMAWGPVFERMAADLAALAPSYARTRRVTVGIAPGELIDKITILRIKADRIADPAKLRNVRSELAELEAAHEASIVDPAAVATLTEELRAINEALWRIEDDIRHCDRSGDFGPRFVELARSVYVTNDRRAAVKRAINELLGSEILEEKSYAPAGGA